MEKVGLTPAPSIAVAAQRVAECPVQIECKVHQLVEVGDGGVGSSVAVFGEMLHYHGRKELLEHTDRGFWKMHFDGDRPDNMPLARMGGITYAAIKKDAIFPLRPVKAE